MDTDQIKVSVILPVYNVEKYLAECLNSLVNQTLREIEIICVNDGATDGSSGILKDYAAKDKRIKILEQENAGAGAARNNGMRIATGEYLSFLDSDDFFESSMLRDAYIKCKNTDADFAVFRSDSYDDEAKVFSPALWTVKESLLPGKRVFSHSDIERDVFRTFNGWAWDKLYKKEFVIKNGLLFQEQRTSNDLYFVYTALVRAKRIAVVNKVLAHHRRSVSDSLSSTREKSWSCFFTALAALKGRLIADGVYPSLRQSFVNYALHFSLWNLNTIGDASFEKLYAALREEYFLNLEITKHGGDYFYDRDDYIRFQRIMSLTPEAYLIAEASDLRDEIVRLKKSLIHQGRLLYMFYSIFFRTLTFIPRFVRKVMPAAGENAKKSAPG